MNTRITACVISMTLPFTAIASVDNVKNEDEAQSKQLKKCVNLTIASNAVANKAIALDYDRVTMAIVTEVLTTHKDVYSSTNINEEWQLHTETASRQLFEIYRGQQTGLNLTYNQQLERLRAQNNMIKHCQTSQTMASL